MIFSDDQKFRLPTYYEKQLINYEVTTSISKREDEEMKKWNLKGREERKEREEREELWIKDERKKEKRKKK